MIALASASLRRRDLLREAGVTFRVVPQEADETPPARATPVEAAIAIARRKALRAARDLDLPVLAADTIVVAADGELLGKPADDSDAQRMLGKLSGTTHLVVTGVCLAQRRGRDVRAASDTTRVTMRTLTPEEISEYVASGESRGKAGAYAIQETADRFVTGVEGSRTNVVGLPMELVMRMLDEAGLGTGSSR